MGAQPTAVGPQLTLRLCGLGQPLGPWFPLLYQRKEGSQLSIACGPQGPGAGSCARAGSVMEIWGVRGWFLSHFLGPV